MKIPALARGQILSDIIVSVAMIGSFACIGTQLLGEPLAPLSLVAVMSMILSWLFPTSSIALALLLLPLGGNRPGTPHAYGATLVGCSLLVGLMAQAHPMRRAIKNRIAGNRLQSIGILYTFISLMSLISLPWPFTLSAVSQSSIALLQYCTEHSLLYPLVSVFLTCLAAAIGILVFHHCTISSRNRILFSAAILAGMLMSIVVGLFDYYGLISLLPFRPLDPIVNPGEVQFRMQSFFAHSGWYAEYVTLTIPFALVLLTLPLPFWLRALIIIASMMLGEFALILSYQRGGWLSYPLTLVSIWAAIYVTRCIEKGEFSIGKALKKSLLKVIISLPLTILFSLLLVNSFKKDYVNPDVMYSYIDRFKAIGNTSDRTDFFFAGTLIGLKHPILGAGSESFATEFEREFEDPQGDYYDQYRLPLHGSAHNVYAQTFAGKGILGLLSLLLCCFTLISGLRYLKASHELPFESKISILIGSTFAVAFLIYGNVQEIFYIQSLQYLFFATIGICASAITLEQNFWKKRVVALLFAVILMHCAWEFVWPAHGKIRWKKQPSVRCFSPEPSGSSEFKMFQWCGPVSFLSHTLTASEIETKQVVLNLQSTADVASSPIGLKVTVRGNPVEHLELSANPTRLVLPLRRIPRTKTIPILFQTQSWFVPAERFPNSQDQRKLSFQVLK